MTEENLTITDQQVLMLECLQDVSTQVEFFQLKNLVTEMYENALLSELFTMTPKQCHSNFYQFKILYNFLLKLDMYHDLEMLEVSLL